MKVSFLTYGCTMNQGDTEVLKGLVTENHPIVGLEESQAVIINSCAVVGTTERKILKKVRTLKGEGKRVLVGGCLSAYSPEKLFQAGADKLITPKGLDEIKSHLGDEEVERRPKLEYPRLRQRESSIAIVPIAEGCLGSCSYCATRKARGSLESFSPSSVVREVKEALGQGHKEIQLTAQDTGCYGFDGGEKLPRLLKRITSLEGGFRVRVGMMNPGFALKILPELVEAYSSPKVYKFLHLPIQSGDDRVLKHMNRGYCVEDFLDIVETFRERYPHLTLSTDVIVGYPGEDEGSFDQTYNLMEELKPEILNITRYSPREKTPAGELPGHHEYVKKERSRKLTSLMEEVGKERNRDFEGRKVRVLVTRKGKGDTLLARSDNYRQVVVREGEIGEFRKVEIKEARSHYLLAER